MSIGFAFFLAASALAAGGAAVSVRRTTAEHGRTAAAKEAAVAVASIGTYGAVCGWLGFSFAAQLPACVLSLVPLLLGRRWVPSLAALTGRH